jgi:hypothetical protein
VIRDLFQMPGIPGLRGAARLGLDSDLDDFDLNDFTIPAEVDDDPVTNDNPFLNGDFQRGFQAGYSELESGDDDFSLSPLQPVRLSPVNPGFDLEVLNPPLPEDDPPPVVMEEVFKRSEIPPLKPRSQSISG